MTTNEMMVILVCLLLGYWVISALMGGNHPPNPDDDKRDGASAAPGGDRQGPPPVGAGREGQWYEVLGIAPSASLEEVQAAYRALISQYHPDKVASLGADIRELAEQKSKAINRAYEQALQTVGGRR